MGHWLMLRLPGGHRRAELAASKCPKMGLGSFGITGSRWLRGPERACNWLRFANEADGERVRAAEMGPFRGDSVQA
jgi:hypothetical protein